MQSRVAWQGGGNCTKRGLLRDDEQFPLVSGCIQFLHMWNETPQGLRKELKKKISQTIPRTHSTSLERLPTPQDTE